MSMYALFLEKSSIMSTAHSILALLKSHIEGEQQFYSAALQMAAQEARQGHGKLAQEIRELIDQAKAKNPSVRYPDTRLSDMILTSELEFKLKRVLTEQRQGRKLREHNLNPRQKLLLVGPPGSGKTMTAKALAGELKLPLFITLSSQLIEEMTVTKGVYYFKHSNDMISRILEQEQGNSLILVATNHPQLLDKALLRRFDDVIEYQLPDAAIIRELIESRLISFEIDWKDWSNILNQANGLAQAEIVRATDDAAKQAVLSNSQKVSEDSLITAIMEQKNALQICI
jgi:SpoVK/Ycf46/Vps4 family AAA+-type ATPase